MSLPSCGPPPSHLPLCHRPAQAYLGDNAGSLQTTAIVNLTIRRVPQIFWFPSVYKSYVYTILKSIKFAKALCLNMYISQFKMLFLLNILTII